MREVALQQRKKNHNKNMKKAGKEASQLIGRRTGKNLLKGKYIRKYDGADVFEDYFSDSSNVSKKYSKLRASNCSLVGKAEIDDETTNEMSNETPGVKYSQDDQASDEKDVQAEQNENNIFDLTGRKRSIARKSNKLSVSRHLNRSGKLTLKEGKNGQLGKVHSSSKSGSERSKKSSEKLLKISRLTDMQSNVEKCVTQRNLTAEFEEVQKSLHMLESSNKNDLVQENIHELEKNVDKSENTRQTKGTAKGRKKKLGTNVKEQNEVKQKKRASARNCATGSRLSTRVRYAPLQYWRNERLLYQFTASGGIESLGLEPGTQDSCSFNIRGYKTKKKKKARRESSSQQIQVPAHLSNNNVYEDGIDVIDPETAQEVKARVVIPYQLLQWKEPDPAKRIGSFAVSKAFDTMDTTVGFIRVKGMKKKAAMALVGYDATFVIMQGKLEVTIHDTALILKENDTFLVPCGNTYSLQNLEKTDALLTYVATAHSFLHELKV